MLLTFNGIIFFYKKSVDFIPIGYLTIKMKLSQTATTPTLDEIIKD